MNEAIQCFDLSLWVSIVLYFSLEASCFQLQSLQTEPIMGCNPFQLQLVDIMLDLIIFRRKVICLKSVLNFSIAFVRGAIHDPLTQDTLTRAH